MKIILKNNTLTEYAISLSGEFDAHGCTEIRDELESIIEECASKTLQIDLKNVSFIDSSGIGAIVFLFKRIQAVDGHLKIVQVQGQPQELLSLLRVHEAIPVEWADSSTAVLINE